MKPHNVDLEPVFVEYQTFLKYLKQGIMIWPFRFSLGYGLEPQGRPVQHGYFNYAGLADEQMDALLESGLHEMDEKKRRQIYVRAHERWLQFLPFIPLFNLNYYMGVSRSLKIPADHFRYGRFHRGFLLQLVGLVRLSFFDSAPQPPQKNQTQAEIGKKIASARKYGFLLQVLE